MSERVWTTEGSTPDVNETVRPLIDEHLKRVEYLIPAWLKKLNVLFISDPEDGETGVSVETQFEYHKATLRFYPGFFDEPDEWQHYALIHEMAHLHTAPLFNIAIEQLEAQHGKDSPTYKSLCAQLRWASELGADTLARAIIDHENRVKE